MKVTVNNMWRIIALVWVVFAMLLFSGCKSKKKITERHNDIERTITQSFHNELVKKDIAMDSFAKKGSNAISIKSIKSIVLTQADSSKRIVITDETGKSLNIKGANVILNETNETTNTQDSTLTKLSKNDKSQIANHDIDKSDTKKQSKGRNSNSDVHTTSTWLWVAIIIIAVILLVYLIYRYRNKLPKPF